MLHEKQYLLVEFLLFYDENMAKNEKKRIFLLIYVFLFYFCSDNRNETIC